MKLSAGEMKPRLFLCPKKPEIPVLSNDETTIKR